MKSKVLPQYVTVSQKPWKVILLTSLLVGTLDALAAIVIYRADPIRMFQFIASGAFGAGEAFSGGTLMVILGIIFHYLIAASWVILFFLIYPASAMLKKNKYVTGVVYGIFIWIIMNQVIIPLSEIPQSAFDLKGALIGASILIFAVGLPTSLIIHRYYWRKDMM
jgi:hypothetical protein